MTRILVSLIFAFFLSAVAAFAQPIAFITNQGDDTVSIVVTSTNTVIATINVGHIPNGVAVSPDGSSV